MKKNDSFTKEKMLMALRLNHQIILKEIESEIIQKLPAFPKKEKYKKSCDLKLFSANDIFKILKGTVR